jgi:hypothetical protein
MYLFSLVLLFALLGYILAISRFGKTIDAATGRLINLFDMRRRSFFKRRSQTSDFRVWALGVGAPLLPDDIKSWLARLSAEEAQDFNWSLIEYTKSLGLQLDQLLDGSLDRDPRMRQVYVEAIVVYSPAYRKARQALKKAAEDAEKNPAMEADAQKQAAEKASSRRKQDATADATETAPAS